MSEVQKRWLTPEEASVYTGISTDKLGNWRRNGKGPSFSKWGRRLIRYDVEELQRFMESAAFCGEADRKSA